VGSDDGTGPGDETGEDCQKIDFLFVIDDSTSMGSHQEALLPSTGAKYGEFVELFGDHGYVDDVFIPDYSVLFDEAIAGIEDACEDFVPPG
jgi:hypothetical protein